MKPTRFFESATELKNTLYFHSFVLLYLYHKMYIE